MMLLHLGLLVSMFGPGEALDPPLPAVPAPVVIVARPAPQVLPPDDAGAAADWSRLRARQRLGRRLTLGGFAGLGAAFVGNLVGGIGSGALGEDPGSIVGALPVAGPFVFAASQSPGAAGWKTFFVVDGLAQVGLLAMGITGAVIARRTRRALAHPRFLGLDVRLANRLERDPDLVRRGRLGVGLAAGGFAGFGVAYVGTMIAFMTSAPGSLVSASSDAPRVWAVLPIAGPFVLAGQADLAGTRALSTVLGVVQLGSLATGISGAVIRGRRMRDAESRVLQGVTLAPWHGARASGLMLRGRF